MNWHVLAGWAQVALIVAHGVTSVRARRGRLELAVSVLAMGLLAAGTFAGAHWALVVAGVFYAVWLLDQFLGVLRPSVTGRARIRGVRTPARPRRLDHALLGAISMVVLALTWFAVGAAGRSPLS